MYDTRLKIFVALIFVPLVFAIGILAKMQLAPSEGLEQEIIALKAQRGQRVRLNTVRGKILDRNGRVLARDQLSFKLSISYELTCYADSRITQAMLLACKQDESQQLAEQIAQKLAQLDKIKIKCTQMGLSETDFDRKMEQINNWTWNLRSFLAWARSDVSKEIVAEYGGKVTAVPGSVALSDFEQKFGDDECLRRIIKVDDIPELRKKWTLVELGDDELLFSAQYEFASIEGISIEPRALRYYPYGSVAAQIIGWVSRASDADRKLFAQDAFFRYMDDEVCGKRPGVEYICEAILRGKRGEVFYDIDGNRVVRALAELGRDVRLSIDAELQSRIEEYISDDALNKNADAPTAAVVLDIGSGEILAVVSLPDYDLNTIRQKYGNISQDKDMPMINRAIAKRYPPGSTIKPLILIAAMEEGKIGATDVISCPAKAPPAGWPRCWIQRQYGWLGHDDQWTNKGRNALKGSCNIYFSRVASRVDSRALQNWLWKFGYGRKVLSLPFEAEELKDRGFRQIAGVISSGNPDGECLDFNDVGILKGGDRRWFGIGQGNCRVSCLQVASTMATIARGGLYVAPSLFAADANDRPATVCLDISGNTMEVVRDGMYAVVNERNGTANKEFDPATLKGQDVRVYGKTGSTQSPANALFSGFAEDSAGRSVAVAVIVEGGQHGSSDAAPLARDIIQFCIDAGYVGKTSKEK
jgi:penicillin-binding protein 2